MRFLPSSTRSWLAALLVVASGVARAEGEGLATSAERVPWARFEARVVGSPATSAWRSDLAPLERSGLKVGRVGVLGDLYFGGSAGNATGESSGFRATSGLIVGPRSAQLGSAPVSSTGGLSTVDRRLVGAPTTGPFGTDGGSEGTMPYLGIGYTSLAARSGWRFRADLGVVSQSPSGAAGIGRVLGGSQSLDDLVRDMKLAPIVQLGVSYSF